MVDIAPLFWFTGNDAVEMCIMQAITVKVLVICLFALALFWTGHIFCLNRAEAWLCLS